MSDSKKPTVNPWSWVVVYFGLAYFCQHFGQGLFVGLPLTLYLKDVQGVSPTWLDSFNFWIALPWMIKPLYGLCSDYLPLFGYRRKTYLVAANLLASAGFFAIAGISEPVVIMTALMVTFVGVAFADVAVDGLMVELGKKTGDTSRYQSVQWFCFQTGAIITSIAAGWFAEHLPLTDGYRYAALVTAVFPLVALVATWFCVKEEPAKIDTKALKQTSLGLWEAITSKTLLVVILFIALWHFTPSNGMPMLFFQTNVLGFKGTFLGIMGAVGSAAAVLGAFLYFSVLSKRFSTKQMLYVSTTILLAGILSKLLYIYLPTEGLAAQVIGALTALYQSMLPASIALTGAHSIGLTLAAVFGCASMVSLLALMTLAAESCPKHVEAVTFSALMAAYNFSGKGGNVFGSWMFEQHLGKSLTLLILTSAGFACVCYLLIPFLPGPVRKED